MAATARAAGRSGRSSAFTRQERRCVAAGTPSGTRRCKVPAATHHDRRLAATAGPFFELAPKIGITLREAIANMKATIDAYNRATGGDRTP